MASTKSYVELKSFLQGAFTPSPVIDFDTIDQALEQANNRFVCLEEIYSFEDGAGFGDPSALCMREESVFLIHAFVPAPESSGVARRFAEQIQQSLRLRNLDGVRIINAGPPEAEDMNDGLWTSATVSVTAHLDTQVATPP